MMTDIHPGRGPGKWTRMLVGEFSDAPRWGAVVWCPECGRPLFGGHTIDGNGQMSPSLGHPMEYPPCGWHVSPRLLGWAPIPPLPPVRPAVTCENCGAFTRSVGGWGTWSGGMGLICPACVAARAALGDAEGGRDG